MRRRRLPLGLLLPGALVVLVGILAALQYRWLGQVSDAERDELRASLTHRAGEFANDFDREINQIHAALQLDAAEISATRFAAFADRFDTWRQAARFPALVGAVYYVPDAKTEASLLAYAPERRVFEPATWPAALAPVRRRLNGEGSGASAAAAVARVLPLALSPILSDVPALVIELHERIIEESNATRAATSPLEVGGRKITQLVMARRSTGSYLIVHLDADQLRGDVIRAVAERHFPDRGAERYRVSIVDEAGKPVLTRHLPAGATIDPAQADVVTPFFGPRIQALDGSVGSVLGWNMSRSSGAPGGSSGVPTNPLPQVKPLAGQFSIFVDHESQLARGAAARGSMVSVSLSATGWQLLVQHADGSLDAAVNNARRRNLWLSFSILSVLAIGVGLVVMNARRSERLAAQQMDFVATVSHELRTPLAVIRAAAQNLSTGVVHDAEQARRYGDLIDAEGRRLTGMVEQVLEYAGLDGARRQVRDQPVDFGDVVEQVVAECKPLIDAQQFEIAVSVAADLPVVLADEAAVRRAVTNLVTNAIKHAADGRSVEVAVSAEKARGSAEVQIAVTDRGRGIDAADLPHVFEPFYRGRHALERQIQGNGLGLSLVRRIATAHGGRVSVKSVAGQGTTFVVHLPAARPDAARQPLAPPATDAPDHAR